MTGSNCINSPKAALSETQFLRCAARRTICTPRSAKLARLELGLPAKPSKRIRELIFLCGSGFPAAMLSLFMDRGWKAAPTKAKAYYHSDGQARL
jgi:hypothetical protein